MLKGIGPAMLYQAHCSRCGVVLSSMKTSPELVELEIEIAMKSEENCPIRIKDGVIYCSVCYDIITKNKGVDDTYFEKGPIEAGQTKGMTLEEIKKNYQEQYRQAMEEIKKNYPEQYRQAMEEFEKGKGKLTMEVDFSVKSDFGGRFWVDDKKYTMNEVNHLEGKHIVIIENKE